MAKQLVLALDVSTSTTGYAIMDSQLKLLKIGEFNISDRKLSDIAYTVAISRQVSAIIKENKITDVVIEDVFYGKNIKSLKTWCRVHGGLGLLWFLNSDKEPMFLMASEARKYNYISGRATKIEVQLKICEEYSLCSKAILTEYGNQFQDLLTQYSNKELTKNKFDYQIKKLSKQFEKACDISEHIADSIVLGKAFFSKTKELQ